jgi:hypothetical protein
MLPIIQRLLVSIIQAIVKRQPINHFIGKGLQMNVIACVVLRLQAKFTRR